MDLTPLRAFGAEAERGEFPQIEVGGFIVSGQTAAQTYTPGKEKLPDACERTEETGREEAGSAARPRQRSSSETAASCAATHTVRSRLKIPFDEWLFEELDGYHPNAKVIARSSDTTVLDIPVGLFSGLPFRAALTLEIPTKDRDRLTGSSHAVPWDSRMIRAFGPSPVPDVRAWARWATGPLAGPSITSHHQNPDRAICACMPGQWTLGVNLLVDYVGMCVTWIGKVLHEREIGFWPGPQHYPAGSRMMRNRRDEFCGCGKRKKYRDCCLSADLKLTPYELWWDSYLASTQYFSELTWQGRQTYCGLSGRPLASSTG